MTVKKTTYTKGHHCFLQSAAEKSSDLGFFANLSETDKNFNTKILFIYLKLSFTFIYQIKFD